MPIPIRSSLLALLCSMSLAACTATPEPLQPLPPVIKTVAVYRDLPESLRTPCDEPQWTPAEIRTDVDLMGLLAQYRQANGCNAGKIKTIDRLYRGAPE